jgi:hypothetical protein
MLFGQRLMPFRPHLMPFRSNFRTRAKKVNCRQVSREAWNRVEPGSLPTQAVFLIGADLRFA